MSFPIAVLLSGGGTTLQNLIDRITVGALPVRIVQVVSSRADVFGVERGRRAGLPVEIIPRQLFSTREAFSERTFDICRRAGAGLIALGGYLQLLKIPNDYRLKVLNIHPALLPAFGGKGMFGHHVHEAVLDYGAKVSGCTVHFLDEQYDHGPIVAQRAVEVRDDDTPDTLAARVFVAECELYPAVIRAVIEGRVSVSGRKVRVTGPI
jgi:phosphoribosylglycinamide formyltransferase 1